MQIIALVEIVNRKSSFTYVFYENVEVLDIVLVPLRNKNELGIVSKILEQKSFPYTLKQGSKANLALLDIQETLLSFISKYYICPIGASLSIFTLLEKKPSQSIRQELKANLKTLSNMQDEILKKAMTKDLSLIFGDTGSGKSEIFFHFIFELIKNEGQALILIPEISLSTQMKLKLEGVFGSFIALWHSKISPKQKKLTLEKLQKGEIKIIAGARSALFLPFSNLKAIVVDEEHDLAYKSFSTPRYNAKDLAVFLSTKGVKVLLASATPSVKSYFLAKKQDYLFRLKGKFFNSNNEIIFDNSKNILSQKVLDLISLSLEQKEQVIIFLPTRANFNAFFCQSCSKSIACPNCSVSLSIHYEKNALLCHYCNFSMKIPFICPNCQSDELRGHRMGTKELYKELQSYFKDVKIGIFDRDHVKTNNDLSKVLDDFSKQKTSILVGTQMISKGHDYHQVGLSVVLGIDYLMNLNDYSAYERAFALIYQVAGRSGRKSNGKVLIQSVDTEFIGNFLNEYELVLQNELNMREGLYPPFVRLAKISIPSKDEDLAKEVIEILEDSFKEVIKQFNLEVSIIGVAKASIYKVNNIFTYDIMLRSKSYKSLILSIMKSLQNAEDNIKSTNKSLESKKSLLLKNSIIDIDPTEF